MDKFQPQKRQYKFRRRKFYEVIKITVTDNY